MAHSDPRGLADDLAHHAAGLHDLGDHVGAEPPVGGQEDGGLVDLQLVHLLLLEQALGIDMVHFGLVMVLNLMIGLLHPPMGTVLFVLSRVAKLSFERTTIAILPWLVPLLITLGLCTYVPQIVLWLPQRFF